MPGVQTAAAPGGLLERDELLDALDAALARARRGDGALVLVAGEAGVGKSSLVRAFRDRHRDLRKLVCVCDDLSPPPPLGPFHDVAARTRGRLGELVEANAPARDVAAALVTELLRPSILVLEDVHWADGASLDVLRLVGRRIDRAPSLVVATFRDDEVDDAHPLRLVLGDVASTPGNERLAVPRLSPEATRRLAAEHGADADALYALTGGNAFFVTEVLAARADALPPTVRDAVLARAARLDAPARRLLDVVALAPGRTDLELLEEVIGRDLPGFTACVASGMLVEEAGAVRFRHELARLASESAIPTPRRRALHRTIAAALARRDPPEHARLAHHGEQAGDRVAVLRHAPPAAEHAAAAGAHREAAAQLARALRFGDGLPYDERAPLLERYAAELTATGETAAALEARQRLLAEARASGDRLREGAALGSIAHLSWLLGRGEATLGVAEQAVALLETLPPGRELARAYATLGQLGSITLDPDRARTWCGRAIELAERLGERAVVAHALASLGTIEGLAGRGREHLERSLALALELGLDDDAARAWGNLVVVAVRQRDWETADREVGRMLRFCAERDLDANRIYALNWRAAAALARCRWDDAAADVDAVLATPGAAATLRGTALLVLGSIRARRGDPAVWEPLDEALEIVLGSASGDKLGPAVVPRVEAALLGGDQERALEEASRVEPARLVDRWVAGELAVLVKRAGGSPVVGGAVPEPFALELAGEHRGAAAAWRALGSPHDAALALAGSDDVADLRAAHEELLALGSPAAARLVARRLRELGVRDVARGPRRRTADNVGGLTPRELDVLRLLADGRRNSEIAERLFLSPRTVDHHVSAILRKLDASSRGEAAAAAHRAGLLER